MVGSPMSISTSGFWDGFCGGSGIVLGSQASDLILSKSRSAAAFRACLVTCLTAALSSAGWLLPPSGPGKEGDPDSGSRSVPGPEPESAPGLPLSGLSVAFWSADAEDSADSADAGDAADWLLSSLLSSTTGRVTPVPTSRTAAMAIPTISPVFFFLGGGPPGGGGPSGCPAGYWPNPP